MHRSRVPSLNVKSKAPRVGAAINPYKDFAVRFQSDPRILREEAMVIPHSGFASLSVSWREFHLSLLAPPQNGH